MNVPGYRWLEESVCPTLLRKGLRLGGAGAFACQPVSSHLLSERSPRNARP